MPTKLLIALACLLAALAVAGCAGGDDDGEAADTGAATTAVAEPAASTPEAVQTAVYERAYSECASTPLVRLAAKYKANQNRVDVSAAVAEAWRKQFGAGPDALEDGRAGCMQGFEDA